jgi:hypothetical protein
MRALLLAAALLVLPLRARAETPKAQAVPELPKLGDPKLDALTLDERMELALQVQVERARRAAAAGDVLGWGAACFPHIFDAPFCQELHGYLVRVRLEDFTSVEAPRGHAKTTLSCFLVPLYQALNEPQLFAHYLNIQATDEKALAINRTIRGELESNVVLRRIYGEVRGARWTDQQFVVVVRKDGHEHEVIFTAKSAGQSLRGINYKLKRPDYIVVDDLYNEDDLNNPESTEKKNAWFNGALMYARAKTRRSSVHLRGTAINQQDQLEKNKKNAKASPLTDVPDATPEGRWVCRTFKAILDWDKGTVLWPELNTFASLLQDQHDSGSFIFAREMQNERWDEVSAIVKRSWLYPADAPSWEFDPAELQIDGRKRILVAVRVGNDPSIGEKNTNDFNGVALVYVVREEGAKVNTFYIVGLWNDHLSLVQRADLLDDIRKAQVEAKRPVTEARIEGVAGFRDYVAEVRRRVALRVKTIGKDENRVVDKITNLQNKSKFFENGRVKLSSRIEPRLKKLLTEQLTLNYPPHDDLRDALLLVLDDSVDWGAML